MQRMDKNRLIFFLAGTEGGAEPVYRTVPEAWHVAMTFWQLRRQGRHSESGGRL